MSSISPLHRGLFITQASGQSSSRAAITTNGSQTTRRIVTHLLRHVWRKGGAWFRQSLTRGPK